MRLGMKRKMFSYAWSLAALADCTAAPLALPFARFRTADIVEGNVCEL
jgi:hypothetical protein